MTAETKFLGRIVTREGIKPNPDAIKKVQSWQAPRCKKELEPFLGFAKYYREFIKDYASFASPLTKLRSKYSTWEWTEETQNAFQILKDKLCSEPILVLPCDDGEYVLDTDASNVEISGILQQWQVIDRKPKLRVLYYGSRGLRGPERNYGAPKLEMLAALTFIEKFHDHLVHK